MTKGPRGVYLVTELIYLGQMRISEEVWSSYRSFISIPSSPSSFRCAPTSAARGAAEQQEESGWNLTFLSVVQLGPAAQQQVDAGAEGGVSSQEDGGASTLRLGPHTAQQLFQEGGRVKIRFYPLHVAPEVVFPQLT